MARKPPVLDAKMSEKEWIDYMAEKWNLPAIDLSQWSFDPAVLEILPKEFVAKRYVFPVNLADGKDGKGDVLIAAMADPGDLAAREEASFLAQRPLIVVVTSHESIDAAVSEHYKL